ncbi:conserved hypothetical protein [Rhodospirillaceae bacterium LM-1]|nr:conserved hypothetical protein [Rhodospirillaceae bacterium LM-1]
MALLAQHGYGKSTKIDTALAEGFIDGAIFSPRDETPINLANYIESVVNGYPGKIFFVDPQFYASTIQEPKLGKLSDYEYFRPELTYRNFVAPASITRFVSDVLEYQRGLSVTHICSPVVAFDSFIDRWASVALTMAQASIQNHLQSGDSRPLLISFVISEQAFRNASELDDFLNIITDLDCDGFYIIMKREDGEFNQTIHQDALTGLLYLNHILTNLNDYTVFHGYSDFISIPLHATGATGTACGWQFSLRRFTLRRFQPSGGGRQPRPRYSSLNLFNSILINPELDQIAAQRLLRSVLTGTNYDAVLGARLPPSSAPWSNETSSLHHWQTLKIGIDRIIALRSGAQRLDEFSRLLSTASAMYQNISHQRIILQSSTTHISQWITGFGDFRVKARL